MSSDRKKPGVAFWATVVVVVVLVAYPLSFGPILAYYRSGLAGGRIRPVMAAHQPLLVVRRQGPEPIRGLLESYAQLCARLWQ